MHAAQDPLGSILGRFGRVLHCYLPAVIRPAVKFRLTAFDQDVRWIGQRNANRSGGVADFESRDRASRAFDLAYLARHRSNLVTGLDEWIPACRPMRFPGRDHPQMALTIARELDRHVGARIQFQ
jgi:hypothetical protein